MTIRPLYARMVCAFLAPFALYLAGCLTIYMAYTGDGFIYSGRISLTDCQTLLAVILTAWLVTRALDRFPNG
jgi:hypothetical protein